MAQSKASLRKVLRSSLANKRGGDAVAEDMKALIALIDLLVVKTTITGGEATTLKARLIDVDAESGEKGASGVTR